MSWDGLKEKKPIPAKSIDGYVRTDEEERNLNKIFAGVFKDDNGKKVLDYIKSITTEAVAGPNIESNKLFHLEGMRFLTAIIQTRIKKGEKDGR
jgi:hypothetical protein|tara:strand:- start:653 stop:934 length:282 start_codon:yes stop_codon:yes gene_type:complete